MLEQTVQSKYSSNKLFKIQPDRSVRTHVVLQHYKHNMLPRGVGGGGGGGGGEVVIIVHGELELFITAYKLVVTCKCKIEMQLIS